jgi:phosphoribosylformylglycinamidine cyclo-ligase
MINRRVTYNKAGVNIEKAEEFIKRIKGKKHLSAFGCLFNLKKIIRKYKEPVLVSSCDGVGTKLKIGQYLNIHNTVGVDLVAMNVNDIICLGAKPLFFLDYIACGKLNPQILKEVIKGIKKGLREACCPLLGGETAEMPGMYKKNEYDLAGFCVGIGEKSKIIDGRNISEGDLVVGLASSGLHSNGFSLVRNVFNKREIRKYAKELLKPTRIYVRPLLSLPSASVKGIAHITGGAFYNKATKILPQGLGMVIKKKSWKIPEIFKIIQQKAALDDKEMYSVFNMGIGMVLVVKKENVNRVIKSIERYCETYVIGDIVKRKRRLILA